MPQASQSPQSVSVPPIPPARGSGERSPGVKLVIAVLIAVALMVPLLMVYGLLWDRQQQAETAQASIGKGWGGQQTIGVGLLAGAGGDSPNAVDVFRPAGAGDKGVAISTMDGTLEVSCPDGTLTIEAGTDVMMTSTSSLDITVGAAMTATGNSVTIAAASTAAFEGANIKVA